MATAPVYRRQDGPSARPARVKMPAKVAAVQFYVNSTDAYFMASVRAALAFINVEDLLRESGGERTFRRCLLEMRRWPRGATT